jgi:nucleoside transporter
MKATVRTQLSVMMFLEFFVWGAWFVTLGTYLSQTLKFDGVDIGGAYSTMPWGAILAPFFVGMVADRFFSAEKVMGILHLVGAVALFYATKVTTPLTFFIVLFIYALCYNPTLALVNAISFNQMESTEKEFPSIRVFGTMGWIVAGLLVGFLKIHPIQE